MIYNSIFSPNLIPLPSVKPITKIFSLHSYLPSSSIHYSLTHKREFPLPAVASIPYPPINADYFETEFSGHGVSFEGLSDSCVVKMGLDNGSAATLMLPSALITSYKPQMWHGGVHELLHTTVSEGQDDGDAVIQGGVSLAFKCESDGGLFWFPTTWALRDVKGSPEEFIQVELICSNSEDRVEVKYIVTLQEDVLSSEVVIANRNSSSLRLMGSIMGHLAVSTPEATYALGLERSDFIARPPLLSNFSIIPPYLNENKDLVSRKSWSPMDIFSSWGSRNGTDSENKEEMEGEEDDNNKHLTERMSRIYTSTPGDFTIMDRGRRNSVVVGREGFNELYIFSPGSSYESYGKYSYIGIGQVALLESIIISPEDEWRGMQYLHNPNL